MKIVPIIILGLSILSLIIAVFTLVNGSKHSKIYFQMKNSKIVSSYDELVHAQNNPFILNGYIKEDHLAKNNMIAYTKTDPDLTKDTFTPELTISLKGGNVKLKPGYGLADFNIFENQNTTYIQGIKPGIDISIYAINYKKDDFVGVKGYELYPGTPKQYINFLSSPYNNYMTYVRIFIGIALLLFLMSIVLNIKK